MGYEVHLVKTESWTDDENRFLQTEWDEILSKYVSASEWLYFDGEGISVKNPSKEQIVTLVRIANQRGWKVQGDDGEDYGADGNEIPEEPGPPIRRPPWNPIREWLETRRLMKDVGPCPFKVGERVRYFARTGVVKGIDKRANHGTGRITVRFENGDEHNFLFFGHGLEKMD